MSHESPRSEIYRDLADRLTRTCVQGIDAEGRSVLDPAHAAPSIGHIAYGVGELFRCRPSQNLEDVHGSDLVNVMRSQIANELDLDNEIHRCFVAMGLGLIGKSDADHPVLCGVPQDQQKSLRDGLIVTREFDNNWEAFNGSVLIGRHVLYGTPAGDVIPHFEKIAAKYDATGYFDDTSDRGNYNNYGLMSINYPLRAVEFLAEDHAVRNVVEQRLKPHALRYVDLIQALVSPKGDTWPFGRSAGVLGQLQCITLIEQCLSKGWIAPDQVNPLRSLARAATRRMQDLYWDESLQWFNFRDAFQRGYNYRASFPMAWDMLRYFFQLEEYAKVDEADGQDEQMASFHAGAGHREIVTNPNLKTAIYVWSDGRDHAVLPIMAGPNRVSGDTLTRPYAPGLFEWTTQKPTPVLCPRITIAGEAYCPGRYAEHTAMEVTGKTHHYSVSFGRLRSNKGEPCPQDVACETVFEFSPGQCRRIDTWHIREDLTVDDFRLEVLQPEAHPHRPNFGDVHQLSVAWQSEIEGLECAERDVGDDPVYISYHCRYQKCWTVRAENLELTAGSYATCLTLAW